MTTTIFKVLDLSDKRRVFAVGDLHGEFAQFNTILVSLGFDPELDAVICVGDLVDRGPNSEWFELYINQPWFHWTLGNHDLQPREFLLGYESADNVSHNGGDWFLAKTPAIQERLASLLENAPLALEVITPGGHRVGIAHADMHNRWDMLALQCTDPTLERYLVNLITGSRETIRAIQNNPDLDPEQIRVHGIDHVFHGHTPIEQPLTFANRTFIDTMVTDQASLTVLDIDQWLTKGI
jgi:serine/threonine protein phosphatase 1